MKFAIPAFIATCLAPVLLYGIPYRAGYQYGFGTAYSAAVDLPRYQIVDLGTGWVPLDVNDRATVILKDSENRLLKWNFGELQVLANRFLDGWPAFLNEKGLAVAYTESASDECQILACWPNATGPEVIAWPTFLLSEPLNARLFSLNDANTLLLNTETQSGMIPFPPLVSRIDVLRLHLDSMDWDSLYNYEWTINMDFSLQQGGEQFKIQDSNNLGDTIGDYYADSAYTPPYSGDPVYAFQSSFFTFNAEIQLGFEPLQVNDARTILGRSPGPMVGLVIVDEFGQRQIGPAFTELATVDPAMSNPDNGLEEIVFGNHYLKRMTERSLTGQPTGQPSPDFWIGTLDDLLGDHPDWSALKSTCISNNGRIAGTGLKFNFASGSWEKHAFLLLPGALVPDWDRSGEINWTDRQSVARGNPWRFWINDDNDSGDLAASSSNDLPSSTNPDYDNSVVDGLRDVVDFFPVLIDIQPILQGVGDLSTVTVTLQQDDSALNFAYTRLHPTEVGDLHLEKFDAGFGPDFSTPPGDAPVLPIGPDPVSLSPAFLENIRSSNRGILLFEAKKSTSKPLELVISRFGIPVFSCTLHVSISPIHDMFRIINLRNADPKFACADPGPWATDTSQPPNLPDSFFTSILKPLRTLIHIHGYNWGGAELPAAHSEIFKRFFQAGANARFIGVSWFGNQGTLDLIGTTFDYNENVANAFITAKYAAAALAPFSGSTTSVFAHSLGNVVVSSCIVDHGLDIGSYFMVNAAVPNEAYLGEQADRRLMVHPDWKDQFGVLPDYSEHLLAANWYRLFADDDRRSALKWKNRFEAVTNDTVCLNFYSSAEDILAPGTGDLPALLKEVWKREQIWTYNEMLKGTTTLATSLTGDIHGGWGFNIHYMDWVNPGGAAHPPAGYWDPMTPELAARIHPNTCIEHPFFDTFSTGDSDFPSWGNGNWLYEDRASANDHLPDLPGMTGPIDDLKNHAKILAEGIPAHSAPAGSTSLPNISLLRNIDIDKQYRDTDHWPDRDKPIKRNRWLHSDYLYPALSHVGRLYHECINHINYLP